jgi:DNA-binding GntR family transcriptional regulator
MGRKSSEWWKTDTSRLKLRSAPEAAAQAIRDAIMAGRLKPGDRIIEQQWASFLGIGQPTLREALKELEFQGMVAKNSYRGTYVTRLQTEDYRKLLEVRLPLEVQAIEQAAMRMDPESAAELTLLVESLISSANECDMAAFHDADVAFHRRIWEMAGNEYLRLCLETVSLRLFVFSVLDRGSKLPTDNHAAAEQHKGILAGLLSRDPARAREAYLTHTIKYWNAQYNLNLNFDRERLIPGSPASSTQDLEATGHLNGSLSRPPS